MTTETTDSADQDPIKPEAQARLDAVPLTNDVVTYTMACWLAMSPRTSAATAQAVERQVREVFGGDEVWIANGIAKQRRERDQQIKQSYQDGERLELLVRRFGLTKRRLFQIVKS